jgi:hypothetical protein
MRVTDRPLRALFAFSTPFPRLVLPLAKVCWAFSKKQLTILTRESLKVFS